MQARILNNKREGAFECHKSDVNTVKIRRVKSDNTLTHSIMPNYCSIYEIIQMQKSFVYLQNQAKRDLFGDAV